MNLHGVVHVLGGLALLVTVVALWLRRSTWRCRWEGAPTLMVATAGTAAVLTNPITPTGLGRHLHVYAGLYHLDDLIGHTLAIICASAMFYTVLTQFGDDQTLRALFQRWVALPLTLTLPLMVTLFFRSSSTHQYNRHFENLPPDSWLTAYWLVMCGTLVHLLALSLRLLIILRRDEPSLATDMYLGTILLTMLFLLLLTVHAVTPLHIRDVAWTVGFLCVIGWTLTPAVSWHRKTLALRRARAILIPKRQKARS